MSNDLISREALKKTIINICGNCSNIIREYKDGVPDGNCAIQHIMNMIDNAPTVEIPVARWDCYCEGQKVGYEKALSERPQGEWICDYRYLDCKCSICNSYALERGDYPELSPYCPQCGARMNEDPKSSGSEDK